MARDYAKKGKGKKKPSASRGNNEQSVSIGLVLFVILIVAGLISLLVYLKWYMPSSTAPSEITKPAASISTKKSQEKRSTKDVIVSNDTVIEQSDKNEVPFYKTHEEITNKEVEIPIEDLKLPDGKGKYVYIMPCGSFREISRAEELEAQVALAGYSSKINKVTVKSGVWYRVELGPFSSKRKAESIRHRLQDNGMNYCKIWPKKIK